MYLLFLTTEGDLKICFSFGGISTATSDFLRLVKNGRYNGVHVERVVKGFLIQIPLKEEFLSKVVSQKDPSFEIKQNAPFPLPRDPDLPLSFDSVGVVGLSKNGAIVISLDACNALDNKYIIIGKVVPESIPLLKELETLETDINDKPLYPPTISFVRILERIDEFSNKEDEEGEEESDPMNSTQPFVDDSFDSMSSEVVNDDEQNVVSPIVTSAKKRKVSFASSVHNPDSNTVITTSTSTTLFEFSNTSNNNNNNNTNNNNGDKMKAVMRSLSTAGVANTRSPLLRHGSLGMRRQGTVILDEQQALKASLFTTMDDMSLPGNPMSRSKSLPSLDSKFYSGVRPKYPKRLVIIRHGQSEQNAALDLMDPDIDALASVRDADIALTSLGKWQASETGKYLANTDKFDICFCSPYERALQTAELIREELPYKLKIYKDNWLREKEFGRLHGLDDKSVKQRFPLEVQIRQRDGKYWYRFPGGENYPAVEIRVHLFLEKICRDYAGRSVLVVTHQVPFKLFRARFQYLDEKGVLGLDPTPNCGIQEYVLDRLKSPEGRMKLKTWNYSCYNNKDAPPEVLNSKPEKETNKTEGHE